MPISPNQGSTSGGTTVTITGVNLANATAVYFGSNLANITANTPTSVTVLSPSGIGAVLVSVTTFGGTSNSLSFYYIQMPIVTSIDPSSGPLAGGNTVAINGYNLSTATVVSFGANTATPTVINDGQLTVVAPAGSSTGSIQVYVTTASGTGGGFNYSYVDSPTILAISPTSGSTIGGTGVTITGTNLAQTTNVTFGGAPAAFGVITDTTVSAITPAGSAGTTDVVITTSGGSATATDGFTYIASPGI
jgi:hypothetical protein